MSAMSTAEKIETIVLCYLSPRHTTVGTCGSLVEIAPGQYRVTADGKTFIVCTTATGWSVSFKGFQGLDSELYVAAANSLDGGSSRDVSKNYNIGT